MKVKIVYVAGIYRIRNKITGEFYIGKANDVLKRYREHFFCLENGTHINPRLQESYNRYGKEAFHFQLIEFRTYKTPLYKREWELIGQLKPHFNLSGPHLPGARAGRKFPEHGKKMKAYWKRRRLAMGLRVCRGKTMPPKKKRGAK